MFGQSAEDGADERERGTGQVPETRPAGHGRIMPWPRVTSSSVRGLARMGGHGPGPPVTFGDFAHLFGDMDTDQ